MKHFLENQHQKSIETDFHAASLQLNTLTGEYKLQKMLLIKIFNFKHHTTHLVRYEQLVVLLKH